MTTAPVSKRRRNKDARIEAILDIAEELFLQEGFAGASMSRIALLNGGSKATLYNHFRSKAELFNTFVERRCGWRASAVFEDLDETSPVGEPAEVLRRIARAYLITTLSEASLRRLRLVAAEAERSPDIGRRFYESGPEVGVRRLSRMIATWTRAGRLRADDPTAAAEFFFGIAQARVQAARLLNRRPELTEAEADLEAERAVRVFMAAFGDP